MTAAGPEPGDPLRLAEGVPDVGPIGVGVREHPRLGAVADPSTRRVDDAGKRDRVGRVREQAQVGDRVLDLGPLVELRAADHLVRDLEPHQGVLEHAALRVDSVEDGDLVPRDPLVVCEPLDLGGHVARLLVLVVELGEAHRLAAAGIGPEALCGCSRLLEMIALAASRIVWVDR